MRRRDFVTISAAVCLIAAATQALAQSWPQQAIHFIISFGAGGGADIVGRILADAMQNRLGQPVVVENKPGAGGILGNQLVASATPDGYTLGIMTAGQIIAAVSEKTCRTTAPS
jgi:tripartite-type tricarboxylate transporter receptor subunit TctC